MTLIQLQRVSTGLLAAASLFCLPMAVASDAPGGILEKGASAQTRAVLTSTQINTMLPQRGKFTFPAPYNTTGVRLTNASDCNGGSCIQDAGYSYWRNINNHVGSDSMLIFVGMNRSQGGQGPSLIQYNKVTDQVSSAGPVFPSSSSFSYHNGEGFYFSATMPTQLYVFSGSSIQRYDVITRQFQTVVDISSKMGNGHTVWQVHSSDDDNVHSATVRSQSTGAMLGCMVYQENINKFSYYARKGSFDECQIDRSGKWLVIKENVDSKDGEDNRIIGVQTGEERVLLDRDGAGGHSDLGHGYMIANDNWAASANTVKVWNFSDNPLKGTITYSNTDWNVAAPAHISHTNSRPNQPLNQQFACGSSANTQNSTAANEIVCFRMDSSRDVLVVAPVMTNLAASGGGSNYNKMPKGNLDVTGQYFIWTSNMGGSRLDAFLVKVPSHLLTKGMTAAEPAPLTVASTDTVAEPAPASPASASSTDTTLATAVVWTNLSNVTLSGTRLFKSAGCNGCPDASARSSQTITTGNGYLEVTATETDLMRTIGLTSTTSGSGEARIDFGLRLQGGYVSVREKGVYKADIAFTTGNVLRVTVHNGKVTYLKNGQVFYTSTVKPGATLRADTAFYNSSSSISTAKIAVATTSTVTAPVTDTTTTSFAPAVQAVTWSSLSNLSVNSGTLSKTGGCDGCPDAYARSSQSITSGNGHLEFTATETGLMRTAGLSNLTSGTGEARIAYGIRLQGGYASVREKGVYKTDVPFTTGNVFRIAIQNGKVTYARNGVVFYTSTAAPAYPQRVQAAFYSSKSSISSAKLLIGTSSSLAMVLGDESVSDALPVMFSGTASAGPTSALISGGVTTDGGATYIDSVTAPQEVLLQAAIAPEPEHTGKSAKLMVVTRNVESDAYFSVSAAGELNALDLSAEAPDIYATIASLDTRHELTLFEGELTESDRGSLEIFVGYQLDDSDEIYYNLQPIALNVR